MSVITVAELDLWLELQHAAALYKIRPHDLRFDHMLEGAAACYNI